MPALRLQLARWQRTVVAILNVVPPGLGAAIAGWRNPHTRLLRNGILQAALVLLGSYPLVIPGAVGVAWAVVDAIRIAQADLLPAPPAAEATPGPRRS